MPVADAGVLLVYTLHLGVRQGAVASHRDSAGSYDHEHMGKTNIIGWDFVKLEMEFKARAYTELFRGEARESVPSMVQFEHDLFQRTEDCRDSGAWPPRPVARVAGRRPEHTDRLAWLILKIREAAGRHLGELRGRSGEWLAEYYFLLALYGLNGIRFDNLEEPQLRAGYLPAGTAIARFMHDRRRPTGVVSPSFGAAS